MTIQLEITITTPIPADDEEIGHQAILACKEPVNAVVDTLQKLGLTATQSRRLAVRRGPKQTVTIPSEE